MIYLSYQRHIYVRELDPTLYAVNGIETFFENVLINIHPIDWLIKEKESHPTHKIIILFWAEVEINKQQKEQLKMAGAYMDDIN